MASSSRRGFLRESLAYSGTALLAPSLSGLIACTKPAGDSSRAPARRVVTGKSGYGPLVAAGPELSLPAGFNYTVLSTSGQPMSDGRPTPNAFDGMAAFALPRGGVRLIRNHENRDTPLTSSLKGTPALAYDTKAGGCTVSLDVETPWNGPPVVVRQFVSLSGTIVNCAGGPTPWGSWLTCEESTHGIAQGWSRDHGYVFEVPSRANSEVRSIPLRAMGRFVHEAVAVDPATSIVYQTEDQITAGFYRFIPRTRQLLANGGTLQMLGVKGSPRYDAAIGQTIGKVLQVSWLPIPNPDPATAGTDPAAVFNQGYSAGAARFSRLEGCWHADDSIYFSATNGGNAQAGQVWRYRPTNHADGELTLVFESPSRDVLDSPDNITVSPRGGIVICEDGFGEQFVRGLTPDGRIFDVAKNLLNVSEFAGVCFSPDGATLFVNIQGATLDAGSARGMTFAIQGPWERGAL
ncbi:MAG: alkaline phosphatase PhoX [Gemmatimonadaceae bacterium]